MKKIRVKLGKESYDIIICSENIIKLGSYIKRLNIGKDAIIITNPAIKKLLGEKIKNSLIANGYNVRFETVPNTEKSKSEKECIRLLNNISRFDSSKRRIFIIALGGGVIGDLAGFVASIYKRGVAYVQVPTTLLAQVDSAIGGKVAIDLSIGKNLVGAFYQPRLVYSNTFFLKTLPKYDLISGLAEVIKYGIIKSPEIFNFVEKNYSNVLKRDQRSLQYIISRCSLIKAGVIEKDVLDNKNMRVILNFGHTIGHAIEASAHYKLYNHGQAIALGMLSAMYVSEHMGLLDKKYLPMVKRLFKKVGLPVKLKGLNVSDIMAIQKHDKKFIHGKNRFVLATMIGKVVVKEGIPESLVKEAVKSLI